MYPIRSLESLVFTGIIHHQAEVQSIEATPNGLRLILCSPFCDHPDPPRHGDSIAVDGVCLTLVDGSPVDRLTFDAIPETLAKTTLAQLRPGQRVHVERALRLSDRLDGHLVLGHIDGVAEGVAVHTDTEWRATLRPPADLAQYLIPKGSVALDGVSLTVAHVHPNGDFDITLIPTTLQLTHLGTLRPGVRVNLECDHTVKTIVATLRRMGLAPTPPGNAS